MAIIVALIQMMTMFRKQYCEEIFLLSKASRPALGSNNLLFSGYWGLFTWEKSGQSVKVTTHLHLLLMSRMPGTIAPSMVFNLAEGLYLQH